MGKLVFYYGAMGCSKTANALMLRFQYQQKGKRVWLIKPAVDVRDDVVENNNRISLIKSRIGISAEAYAVHPQENIIITYNKLSSKPVDLLICDECQFLSAEQVDQLKYLAEVENLIVYCYGLRTDSNTNLFCGSKRLFEMADEIHYLHSVCSCGREAIVNAKFDPSGKLIVETSTQVDPGGDEKYRAVCWTCWRKLQNEEK